MVLDFEGREDNVTNPSHYQIFKDKQAIEVIARSMSPEAFKGYCFGNVLKYRLRAGKKGNAEEDLRKAKYYEELYDKYSHLALPF